MKKMMLTVFALAFVATVNAAPPAIPATPTGVEDVVSVTPFTLDNGYEFQWRKDRPFVTTGQIVVLRVDPALVHPRQVAEPVLYVGDTTAARLNQGNESGHVIALVPGDVDLTEAPIWFGTPALPEQVDAKTIATERALAEEAGIAPISAKKLAAARAAGGESAEVADLESLLLPVAAMVRQYSPAEQSLAETMEMTAASK